MLLWDSNKKTGLSDDLPYWQTEIKGGFLYLETP